MCTYVLVGKHQQRLGAECQEMVEEASTGVVPDPILGDPLSTAVDIEPRKWNRFHAPKETSSEAWEDEVTPLPMFCPCKSAGQWGGVTGPTPGILTPPLWALGIHLQSENPPHRAKSFKLAPRDGWWAVGTWT